MKRKKLYGVWLHNMIDRRDDEWVGVMAHNSNEARKKAAYDISRFTLGHASLADDFCKSVDIPRNFLKKP